MEATTRAAGVLVLGGSAGALRPLERLLGQLPPDLPRSVLVAVHRPRTGGSNFLATILDRASNLPVTEARAYERLVPGRVVVAPAGVHLTVERDHAACVFAPRQDRHRPSIDVLFRSAALAHGPRAIAVLMSGNLDDGVDGLTEIGRHGGTAIVQDPKEAEFPALPENAIAFDAPTCVLPIDEIADVVVAINGSSPSPVASDECGAELHFRCRVGRAFGSETPRDVAEVRVEAALWNAVRILEERAELAERLGRRMRATHAAGANRRYEADAERFRRDAADLRARFLSAPPVAGADA